MVVVALLLVLVPVLELYVLVEVAGSIGVIETLLLLALTTVGGVWLVKRQGLGVVRRVQQQLQRGELPAAELVDGLLVVVAGLLLLVPGFVTDAAALLLLVPFVRRPLRGVVARRVRAGTRVTVFSARVGRTGTADVIDVTGRPATSAPTGRPVLTAPELGAAPDDGVR